MSQVASKLSSTDGAQMNNSCNSQEFSCEQPLLVDVDINSHGVPRRSYVYRFPDLDHPWLMLTC